VQDCKSFKAMRPLAQLLVMKAKKFYDRKTQGPIRLSARTAAQLVKTTPNAALSFCKEAVHHGKGRATSYILTDEMFHFRSRWQLQRAYSIC
jgi:hypothetical protein